MTADTLCAKRVFYSALTALRYWLVQKGFESLAPEGDKNLHLLQQKGNARHRNCTDCLGLYIATSLEARPDLPFQRARRVSRGGTVPNLGN